MSEAPRVLRIVESGLYVEDLEVSRRFWRRLLGAEVLVGDDRICALAVAPAAVLLLFRRGASAAAVQIEGGVIPGHDGHGTQHLAFAIDADELATWRQRLAACGVQIESEVRWVRGGTSLYFRDPDGHCVELATPGVWENY